MATRSAILQWVFMILLMGCIKIMMKISPMKFIIELKNGIISKKRLR